MPKIKFTVIVSVSIAVRDPTRHYFERSRRIRAHFCVREPRTRPGSFCFSTAGSRDAFGSRFDHIKRQMSFYGDHCHPGTACRESPSPVSYARTFLVPDESFLQRLIKNLNDLLLGHDEIE